MKQYAEPEKNTTGLTSEYYDYAQAEGQLVVNGHIIQDISDDFTMFS